MAINSNLEEEKWSTVSSFIIFDHLKKKKTRIQSDEDGEVRVLSSIVPVICLPFSFPIPSVNNNFWNNSSKKMTALHNGLI